MDYGQWRHGINDQRVNSPSRDAPDLFRPQEVHPFIGTQRSLDEQIPLTFGFQPQCSTRNAGASSSRDQDDSSSQSHYQVGRDQFKIRSADVSRRSRGESPSFRRDERKFDRRRSPNILGKRIREDSLPSSVDERDFGLRHSPDRLRKRNRKEYSPFRGSGRDSFRRHSPDIGRKRSRRELSPFMVVERGFDTRRSPDIQRKKSRGDSVPFRRGEWDIDMRHSPDLGKRIREEMSPFRRDETSFGMRRSPDILGKRTGGPQPPFRGGRRGFGTRSSPDNERRIRGESLPFSGEGSRVEVQRGYNRGRGRGGMFRGNGGMYRGRGGTFRGRGGMYRGRGGMFRGRGGHYKEYPNLDSRQNNSQDTNDSGITKSIGDLELGLDRFDKTSDKINIMLGDDKKMASEMTPKFPKRKRKGRKEREKLLEHSDQPSSCTNTATKNKINNTVTSKTEKKINKTMASTTKNKISKNVVLKTKKILSENTEVGASDILPVDHSPVLPQCLSQTQRKKWRKRQQTKERNNFSSALQPEEELSVADKELDSTVTGGGTANLSAEEEDWLSQGDRDLQLAFLYEDNSDDPVDDKHAVHVKQVLVNRITERCLAETKEDLVQLQFEKSGLVGRGLFLITCSNKETLEWTLEQSIPEVEGRTLKAVRAADISGRVKIGLTIPRRVRDPGTVLTLLRGQNPGLNAHKWRVVSSKEEGDGLFLSVMADEEAVPVLDLLDWCPHFELSRVRAVKIDAVRPPFTRGEEESTPLGDR